MRETAYAKLNLALHVRAREPDGYHRIETVFAFCEDGDELEAGEPRQPNRIDLDVAGAFAEALSPAGRGLGEGAQRSCSSREAEPPHPSHLPAGDREHSGNLVHRAASALAQRFGITRGVRLRLDKRLPVAAGIGGGSADAAAALRLLVRWWELPGDDPALHEIARSLGADVPACLASRTVGGEGRGDVLTEVDGSALTGRPVLLVNPRVPVPTGPVFAAWDGVDRGPLGSALVGRNDLEAAARAIAPVIGDVLEALAGAPIAAMSGSGASCFGLYEIETDRDAAAARIAAARPHWWLLRTRLR
jgi:4-diphosphocytidyl-2-C-methyl-D-erythritol kinase